MLIVIKILFVALAVAGQAKLFPDRDKPIHSELDTLVLPHEHPEWVLARRAMADNGLCQSPDSSAALRPADDAAHPAPERNPEAERMFAEACD